MLRRLALVLLIAACALPAQAGPRRSYVATVTAVVDGDTVWVRPPSHGRPFAVRVQGIDAPEICQAWGPQARDALRGLLLARTVTVAERGRDAYGRVLARLERDGTDVGAWLVSNGLAWSDGFRHHRVPYADLQAAARSARRGLWSAGAPIDPRRFRRQHGRCLH
ncbi:MAG: thermonuclease family protein [Ramlibacter sp.]